MCVCVCVCVCVCMCVCTHCVCVHDFRPVHYNHALNILGPQLLSQLLCQIRMYVSSTLIVLNQPLQIQPTTNKKSLLTQISKTTLNIPFL